MYRLVMISIKSSETAQKNALASMDVIVTQLLRYHMPLLYFICNYLIDYSGGDGYGSIFIIIIFFYFFPKGKKY